MTQIEKLKKQLLTFWLKWEHHFNIGGAIAGFMFDLWLASRPDSLTNNLLLLVYLLVAGVCIVLLNHRTRKQMDKESPSEPLALLFILQFCFGGLAGNMLILYSKSGTLGGSALFVLMLLGILLGNEFLRNRYTLLRFNIAVYYLLLLTYVIIAAPTFIFHSIGTDVFIYSGIISLVLITAFLAIIRTVVLRGDKERRHFIEVGAIVGGIFMLFNAFYFLDIIPPVPLSMKGIGVYHTVAKSSAGYYTAVYEAPAWFVFWRDTASTYTIAQGQPAYCFSAVFAPGELRTPITHRWEYYDTKLQEWVTKQTISFSIFGGRDNGYRGYTIKQRIEEGQWRCNVETHNGALIGRIDFTVRYTSETPNLSTTTL